jgi:hypothetical protein
MKKYTGHPPWSNGELQTCGAFVAMFEEKAKSLSGDEAIIKVLEDSLGGPALAWLKSKTEETTWTDIRSAFMEKFTTDMTVRDKVKIRQSLRQKANERVQEFLDRCTYAQYAITDDSLQSNAAAFERDVLLNFLLGMKQDIQGVVVACNERTLDGFAKVALDAEKDIPDDASTSIKKEDTVDDGDLNNDVNSKNWSVSIVKNSKPSKASTKPKKKPTAVARLPVVAQKRRTSCKLITYNEDLDLDDDGIILEVEPDVVKDEEYFPDDDDDANTVTDTILAKDEESTISSATSEVVWKPVTEGMLMCRVCGRYVQNQKRYDVHMLVRHRKDQTKFACDMCNKVLKSEASLKKHVQFTCMKDRPVSCGICSKNFIDNKSVRIHIQSVHMKEKPHLCAECGRGFCTPTSLRTHRENVHEKLKKYICKVCKRAFGNQGNLYVHNQRHHERHSYCCETCGKRFSRPHELRRHSAVKHGSGPLPNQCDQCVKSFFEPKELRQHVSIVHEGERPCSCPCCPETFTRKCAMRRHIRRKHPEMVSTLLKKKTTEKEDNDNNIIIGDS